MPNTATLLSREISRILSSVRTGIVLLILAGVASAAGTFILQRPLTEPDQMARAYSPAALRWLDGLGLTDVFHSWWFAALLTLLGLNIVLASLERFPGVWHFFTKPYRRPEPHFIAHLPAQQEIPIRNAQAGIEAAERAFARLRIKTQRVGNGDVSLYAEKHRIGRLGAYVVHLSLLFIFAGGVVDAVKGYRGYLALSRNEQSDVIEMRDGSARKLPFTVRCEGAGQENYPDGSPRRWWSKLTVIEDGREVLRKEVEVNEPLVYRGLRFFQSSYGEGGQARFVRLAVTPKAGNAEPREIVLRPDEKVDLDPDTSVHIGTFVPDFVINGGKVESRSAQPNNPAIQLCVESKQANQKGAQESAQESAHESKVWLFPRFPNFSHPEAAPYRFEFRGLEMDNYTGLQVAYEPGQWAVWFGCALLAVGLAMAFYMVHTRYWVVPVNDGRGRLVLWVGASASKNREDFNERFRRLVEEIHKELRAQPKRAAERHEAYPVNA